ncbi:hypothetical protein MA16_Dca010896 [Dendrobium catenatum]|uniref:Retrotransposon gag domain-containing protein n=1 Tax=Dendrobium catenatum TaxID=906689 RepID=A0A2I0X7B1_9ASPA|nr:hypothetical protein MA16_Dca010896 [Dendrobium catenatum]
MRCGQIKKESIRELTSWRRRFNVWPLKFTGGSIPPGRESVHQPVIGKRRMHIGELPKERMKRDDRGDTYKSTHPTLTSRRTKLPPRQRNYDPRDSSEGETDHRCAIDWHRNRRLPRFEHSVGEFKVKLDIPFFYGHLHIEDYLDWEKAIENFFDYMDIIPEKQVKYVACRLKGGASAWWEQTLQTRRRERRGSISTWKKMKQLLRAQFLPTDFEQILYMRYQHCAQGLRTVSEYTEEFNRLSARNDLHESTTQLVARYIGGLKESIQDKLELNAVWLMPQAVNLAMKV